MTTSIDPDDPNQSPYVPQVHNSQRSNQYLGPPQDQIRGMRGKLIESILQLVMQAITGAFLPGPLGSAFTQLQNFFANILPVQIKQPLTDLVNILVDVLDSIPFIGPPLGNALEDLAAMFGLLKDKADGAQQTGESAQVSADNANVGVAQLAAQLANQNVPGGTLYQTTFNQQPASNLGPDFAQTYGPGFGYMGTDGNNASWYTESSNPRWGMARLVLAMATDFQAVAFVQDNAFPVITNPSSLQLIVRGDTTLNNRVEAIIAREYVEIAKVVGGVRTVLANVLAGEAGGDRWTLKAGTDVDVRQFILYRNDDAVITVTDTVGPLSAVGPSNYFTGLGMNAGSTFFPFPIFNFSQIPPPRMQSFTAYDRPAAA